MHILIDRDAKGNLTTQLFSEQQTSEQLLSILGYTYQQEPIDEVQEEPVQFLNN